LIDFRELLLCEMKTLAKEMHYNQIVVNSLPLRDNLSLRDSARY
jgi:hypothetical protein